MARQSNRGRLRSPTYLEWLSIRAGLRANSKMAKLLHSITFIFTVPNDDNRADEGTELRYLYESAYQREYPGESILEPCTVLEMLVALAQRAEDAFGDTGFASTREEWFNIMIDNLGLRDASGIREQRSLVMRMLTRKYDEHGNGGLFPLEQPQEDQRRLELWYQLNYYVMENDIPKEVLSLGWDEED